MIGRIGVLLLLIACGPAVAQLPDRDIGGGEGRTKLPRPGAATPSLEARSLREEAEKLRLKSADLAGKADELRDNNKDMDADGLDQRAESLLEHARSLERRAQAIELSGGQHPESIDIPDY